MRFVLLVLWTFALAGCGVETSDTRADERPDRGRVVRVVDGDTIKVRIGSRIETVRLIGIDTPELAGFGRPDECGARAAARELRRHALASGRGRNVRLVADPTQARRDRFDRRLAYVERLAGGRDLGREVIAAGWGRTYVYGGVPFRRVSEYRRAERAARRAGAGGWSRCADEFR